MLNLFIDMFTYFPLPITRFDEMALIRHLVSLQEAIKLELFCLRLKSYKIFLKNLLAMAQLKGDKGVVNIQENLNEQHGRLMEK